MRTILERGGGKSHLIMGFVFFQPVAPEALFRLIFARFGKPDSDRLFRAASAVLALANMIHLLFDEFAGLRTRGFPSAAARHGA